MALNAAQVKAKARMAVKRREELIEQEEIEGGEINLIPYLDIVTNLMLFLLASVSAGLVLGQLNTTLPDKGPPAASMNNQNPDENPDDKPLKLVVSVLKDKVVLWSITQLEGTIKEPKLVLPLSGQDGSPCDDTFQCQSNYCSKEHACAANPDPNVAPSPVFDYRALNDALVEIATRRYQGKKRKLPTYQAILMADGTTPYATIVSIMDAMRCRFPTKDKKAPVDCYFPTADEYMRKAAEPIDKESRVFDTDRVDYDPSTYALFPDILFSTGFE
jgi:biopolymer transport protein ExbD